jgi:hypothetical protein
MNEKIVDFQASKENQIHKRKEAKLDAMRQAFRLARGEADKAATNSARASKKKRRKSKK